MIPPLRAGAIADRLAAVARQVDRAIAWKLAHELQCEARAHRRARQRRYRRGLPRHTRVR